IAGLALPALLLLSSTLSFAVFAEHAINRFLIALDSKVTFLNQPLNQLIYQFIQSVIARVAVFIEELVVLLLIEQARFAQRSFDRLPQLFQRVFGIERIQIVLIPPARIAAVLVAELIFKPTFQQVVRKGFH